MEKVQFSQKASNDNNAYRLFPIYCRLLALCVAARRHLDGSGKPHHKNIAVHFGIFPLGGGVLTLAGMVCGTYIFLGEMSMYKRAFAWFCPTIGATECPFDNGGGSNGYLGNAQMNCYIFITVGDLVMDLFRYPSSHPIQHIALIVPNCSKPFNTELMMNWWWKDGDLMINWWGAVHKLRNAFWGSR